MSWWWRAQFLSPVWKSPPPLQNSALCLCSSVQAVKVRTYAKIMTPGWTDFHWWCSYLHNFFLFLFYHHANKPNLISCCVTDEGLSGADLSLSSCVVALSRGPCRDGVCGRALIYFSPVTDFVKDGNRTTQISIKSIVTQNFLWNGYSPEPAEVKLICCDTLRFGFFICI